MMKLSRRKSMTRLQLEEWLKTIEINADRLLDVGGTKKLARNRLKKCTCNEYKVLDTEGPADYYWDINYSKSREELFGDDRGWDAIFCLELSEYLWDPVSALSNLTNCLNERGRLFMSFHFIYPIHDMPGTDMLRFTRYWIANTFDRLGYRNVKIRPRAISETGASLLERFYYCEGMRANLDETLMDTGYLVEGTKG
jgi:hypothetical protein